jgi:hypothetical protein
MMLKAKGIEVGSSPNGIVFPSVSVNSLKRIGAE